jgi:hypothetical protein
VLLIVSVGLFVGFLIFRKAPQQEAAERERLKEEVLSPLTDPDRFVIGQADAVRHEETQHEVEGRSHEQAVTSRDAVYDQLLINDYALGLTQARRAFTISIIFSVLGGAVLILGISLAIFRADTGGQVAGAAITSAAGVLTSGLSQLFQAQSSKALKHLESQAVELRKDVRAQTNAATAQRLLEEIADHELRSRLQAALILEFTGAKLPDLGSSLPLQADQPNGQSRHPSTHLQESKDSGSS